MSIGLGAGAGEGTGAELDGGAETIIGGFDGTGEVGLGGSLGESGPGQNFVKGDAAGEDNENSAGDGDGGAEGESEGKNGDSDDEKEGEGDSDKEAEGDGDKEAEGDGDKEGEDNGNDSNPLFAFFSLSLGGPTASTTCSTLL